MLARGQRGNMGSMETRWTPSQGLPPAWVDYRVGEDIVLLDLAGTRRDLNRLGITLHEGVGPQHLGPGRQRRWRTRRLDRHRSRVVSRSGNLGRQDHMVSPTSQTTLDCTRGATR